MAKFRIDRLNEDFKREISAIIREMKDPRLNGVQDVITVTNVSITADLKYAKVYFSVYGDAEASANAAKALLSAAGFIRKNLSGRIDIRYTPELKFIADDSIAFGAHISKVIEGLDLKD